MRKLLTVFALFVAIASKADVPCDPEFTKDQKEQTKLYVQKLYKANDVKTKDGKAVVVTEKVFDFLMDEANDRKKLRPANKGEKHQITRFDNDGNASTATEKVASGERILEVKVGGNWYPVAVEEDCKWLAIVDDIQKAPSPDNGNGDGNGLTQEQMKIIADLDKRNQQVIDSLAKLASRSSGGGAVNVNYNPTYNFNGGATANNTNSGNSGSGSGGGTPKKYILVNPKGQMMEVDQTTMQTMRPAWTSYSGCVGCQQATMQNGYMAYAMNPQMYRAQLTNLRTGSGANVVGGIIAPISSEVRNWLYFAGVGGGNRGGGTFVRYGNGGGGGGTTTGRHYVGPFRRQ